MNVFEVEDCVFYGVWSNVQPRNWANSWGRSSCDTVEFKVLCINLSFLYLIQARNFWKQVFELTVDRKGPPSWLSFWSGLEAPNPFAPRWRPRLFSRQKSDFFQKSIKIMISHHQSIDNSLLSYQKKQHNWTKNGRVIAKKRMLIYIWNNWNFECHFGP